MEEIGTVIRTDTEFALVEVQKGSECKACEMKDACVESSQEGYRRIKAKNDLNSAAGDKVIIEIEPKAHVLSSFIVFILPVVFAVAGYYLGVLIFGDIPEYKPIIFCILAFIVSFMFIRIADRKFISKKSYFIPVISQIIEK
ncbi:SoxR reducing system RseC family protein [candidate division KSB1 bacterium]